jgi:hypothetical protein
MPIHALRYREKARKLHEAADSAANDELREQFTSLARQYEQLAAWTEGGENAAWPAKSRTLGD